LHFAASWEPLIRFHPHHSPDRFRLFIRFKDQRLTTLYFLSEVDCSTNTECSELLLNPGFALENFLMKSKPLRTFL
jgi:hypothetical protein